MNAFLVSLLLATLALSAVSAAPPKETTEEKLPSNVTTGPVSGDQAMLDLLTAFKRIMPCGDAKLGIPIMAPYRIPKISVDVNEELLVLKGHIKNLVVAGINDFIIIELKTNSSNNRTSFDMIYKNYQVLGEFDLHVDADIAGFRYVQHLKGLLDLMLLNVRVTGGMTIGANENGGMLFSDIEYYVQVGDIISDGIDVKWSVAVNNFVNQYIRDSTMLFLQTNREPLNEMMSGYITPKINFAFANITASEYVQAMVEATELYNSIDCKV